MALPETIPVKYTEEEADSLSIRPVVRQTFRLAELVDMVVSVTGKDAARIRQILRAGTVVFHFYRYWWPSFEAADADLATLLAGYPEPEPGRIFRAADCAATLLTSDEDPPRISIELPRDLAARPRLFHRRSFWDALVSLADAFPPSYITYSYPHRADLFQSSLSPSQTALLAREATHSASRRLRARLHQLPHITRILFVCPRPSP